MKKKLLTLCIALVTLTISPLNAAPEPLTEAQQERLVVLGAAVGESVYALGKGDYVVARDLSCQHPAALAEKPAVGYHRALNTEGILSLNPTAILATSEAGPPNVIAQLKQSKIPVVILPVKNDVDSLQENLKTLGTLLGAEDKAAALSQELAKSLSEITQPEKPHRVLFLLSPPGSGRYMAAGTGTAADAMITLAGGVNLFHDMPGYKPVSAETLAGREPDVVLVASMHGEGQQQVDPQELPQQFPFLSNSPAAQNDQFSTLDIGKYLTFGPHTGTRAAELHQMIYP